MLHITRMDNGQNDSSSMQPKSRIPSKDISTNVEIDETAGKPIDPKQVNRIRYIMPKKEPAYTPIDRDYSHNPWVYLTVN